MPKKPNLKKLPKEILQFNISKEEIIEELVKVSACQRSIEWLRKQERTLKDVLDFRPDWVLWALKEGVIPEELSDYTSEIAAHAAVERPGSALALAPREIPAEIVDWCAEQLPCVALHIAFHLLTPERLAWCARQCPFVGSRVYCNQLVKGIVLKSVSHSPITCSNGIATIEHSKGKITLAPSREGWDSIAYWGLLTSTRDEVYDVKEIEGKVILGGILLLSTNEKHRLVNVELRLYTEDECEVIISISYHCKGALEPITQKAFPRLIFEVDGKELEMLPYAVFVEGDEVLYMDYWDAGASERVILAPSAKDAIRFANPWIVVEPGERKPSKVLVEAFCVFDHSDRASEVVDLRSWERQTLY